MKAGTFAHPKTKHLAVLLGVDQATAYGILCALCNEFAPAYAPQGDVGRRTDMEIALGVGSSIDPGTLVAALVESRWLCRSESHRLLIHHFDHHAEESVKRRLKRKHLLILECGCPTSDIDGRPSDISRQSPAPVREAHGTRQEVLFPDPVPEESKPAATVLEPIVVGAPALMLVGATRIPPDHPLYDDVREAYRMGGCQNPLLCHEHFVATKQGDGEVQQDWRSRERAWAYRHASASPPCVPRRPGGGRSTLRTASNRAAVEKFIGGLERDEERPPPKIVSAGGYG